VGHLLHGTPRSAVAIYEKDYPNVTYVIHEHWGFCILKLPACKYDDELEKRMASWPVPSLVTIKGSWLSGLPFGYSPMIPPGQTLSSEVDGYLYLGPGDLLLYEHTAANIALDKNYMAELQQRFGEEPVNELRAETMDPTFQNEALAILSSQAVHGSGGPKGNGPGRGGPR
jgi:hypothetical protein